MSHPHIRLGVKANQRDKPTAQPKAVNHGGEDGQDDEDRKVDEELIETVEELHDESG